MTQKPHRTLAELLESPGIDPFKGLSTHAIEDGMSQGDVDFLNETLRESRAEIAAGLGFVLDKNYFQSIVDVLKAAQAKKERV
jgi:hypothetical protein